MDLGGQGSVRVACDSGVSRGPYPQMAWNVCIIFQQILLKNAENSFSGHIFGLNCSSRSIVLRSVWVGGWFPIAGFCVVARFLLHQSEGQIRRSDIPIVSQESDYRRQHTKFVEFDIIVQTGLPKSGKGTVEVRNEEKTLTCQCNEPGHLGSYGPQTGKQDLVCNVM